MGIRYCVHWGTPVKSGWSTGEVSWFHMPRGWANGLPRGPTPLARGLGITRR